MWNYYKTVVVNSAEPEPGRKMFAKDAKIFDPIKREMVEAVNVWRNGQYDPAKIDVIHKTVGYEGKNAKAVIDCNGLVPQSNIDSDDNGIKDFDLGLYQLSFKVEMDGKFLSDYASPAYQGFFKPIVVGLNFVDEEVANDAEKIAKYVAAQINLALPENNKFIKVDAKDGKVNIEATDNYMFFTEDSFVFEKYEFVGCDTCLGEYIPKKITVTVEEGRQPFATGTWILENLRLPNTLNYRYFGSNDEMPIAGLTYTQYTFDYASERPGLGGHSGVGQGITAITTHTFYVAPEAVKDFENAFADVKGGIKETYLSGGEIKDTDNDGIRDE